MSPGYLTDPWKYLLYVNLQRDSVKLRDHHGIGYHRITSALARVHGCMKTEGTFVEGSS